MEKKIQITLSDLQKILDEQKKLVVENLLIDSGYYNNDNNEDDFLLGDIKSLNINKEKFNDIGINSDYPNDFNVLTKYLV